MQAIACTTQYCAQMAYNKSMKTELSLKQHLIKALVYPLIVFIWRSCRVEVVGEEYVNKLTSDNTAFIPCYWHQQHIFCAHYLLQLKRTGLKLGFLISPSKDGDIPASILESKGVTAIRGSSNRTGAQALRDLFMIIKKEDVTTVTTPDGPTGPIYTFKTGAVMLSQLAQVPILPMAYRASSAWQFSSWDRFLLPKPFSKVTVHIGQPEQMPKSLDADEQQDQAERLGGILNRLSAIEESELNT